jgi:signal transduction histidine kinase
MGSVNIIFAGITIIGLISVIILLMVFHQKDTRDLRDRLMARDFHDYSVGKVIQQIPPKVRTDVEEAEAALGGISDEDRHQGDRLPVT